MSPQARESWRAQPETVGHPLPGPADARRQLPNRAVTSAANVRGTRSFEPPRRDLVVQNSGGREHCGGDLPVANRGREMQTTSRREAQNENRRENGVPSIAYGGRDPQLRAGRDLMGGAEANVGRESQAAVGRRLPTSSTGREPQINSARDRPVTGTAREQQMMSARDRQASSGRRAPGDGQSRAQSLTQATRAKTPPLRTGGRAEKKLETAQQTLRRPPPAQTAGKPAAPVRKGIPSTQRTTVAVSSQQCSGVVAPVDESPNAKLRTCSPPISPPGSQGSPSTVPRVSCSGRSSSPSTVPAVASPNSGPRSHANSPTSGLHDEPPHHSWPLENCNTLKEQASPPRAPSFVSPPTTTRRVGALMECDINSLSSRRPGIYEDRKPVTPISGAENMGVSPMQENISSPGSDQSKDTSVSFNLSPIRRVNVPPSGVGVSHPYSLSSDTLSLRSSLPPASLASAPSSRTTSSAPSRRESMQPPASETVLPPGQAGSDGGDAAGGPAIATGVPNLAAPGGELGDVAAGGAAGNRSNGSVSKVAEMKSFWEKQTRPSIGSIADAGADACGLAADRSRTPGGLRPSSSSWLRCASDMVRRMKHEEKTTSQLTKRLLERLRVEERDADYGSPTDSSGDTSDLFSPGSGQDEQESPTMQVCKGLLHNSNAMWRTQRQMSKAIIRVLSLDSGRDGAKDRGKDIDCPWCGRSDVPGNCQADVEGDRCIGVDGVPLVGKSIVDPSCDPCFSKEGVEDGSAPHRVSIKTEGHHLETPDLDSHRRASFQSTQQPESEADELLPSPAQGNEESACLTDEAEPAREPQPLESPREFDWSKTTKASEDHDHDPAETVPSTVELNSSTEENTPIPESPDRESAADRSAADRSTLSVDDSFVASAPRATEDGMPRSETFLQQIEQCELSKELRIIVPEGMSANRVVSFFYEGRRHEVEVPQGYAINSEVPITIAKRPPLELTHRLSVLRCHAQFQDRGSIVDSLRHGARPVQHEQGSENPMLQAPEFRHRQYLYSLLRGGAMHPLLPYTPEDDGALAETSFTE